MGEHGDPTDMARRTGPVEESSEFLSDKIRVLSFAETIDSRMSTYLEYDRKGQVQSSSVQVHEARNDF